MNTPQHNERRMNWPIRNKVEKIVGRLHIGDIDRVGAALALRDLMLNVETANRIINRVPASINFTRD